MKDMKFNRMGQAIKDRLTPRWGWMAVKLCCSTCDVLVASMDLFDYGLVDLFVPSFPLLWEDDAKIVICITME